MIVVSVPTANPNKGSGGFFNLKAAETAMDGPQVEEKQPNVKSLKD